MNFVLKISILIIVSLKFIESGKILAIFPTPSISHQIVYRALTQDLANRGHELTILTPDPVRGNNSNITEIDLSGSYRAFKELFNYGEFKDVLKNEMKFVRKASVIFEKLMNEQLSYPEVQNLIKNSKKFHFDLLIIELTSSHSLKFMTVQ